MSNRLVGALIVAASGAEAVARIVEAEELGLPAVWLSAGSGGGEPLAIFAAAAGRTKQVLMGTSIVPIFPRHPIIVAQQARVIASLAPGRFRLGLGTGGRADTEGTFGVDFHAPVGHLREYVSIIKSLLQGGSVDHGGGHYEAHSGFPSTVDVPVMAAALRTGAFAMAGAESDGAISWVCPFNYLRDSALPAMRDAASEAGRDTPPLIVHAPVCVHDDVEEARGALREQMGRFASVPYYARMFAAAGFPDSEQRGWTDEMADSVLIAGDEQAMSARLDQVFQWGASEVIATVITAGGDVGASRQRTLNALAQYAA